MITVQEENVHVYRTTGTSDEQASILKELFLDLEFSKKHNLCSVNSINWSRICVQCSYYVWSYLQIYGNEDCFGLPVNYCIPTGGKNSYLNYSYVFILFTLNFIFIAISFFLFQFPNA